MKKRALINLTEYQITLLDSLVKKKVYFSRSEAIRDAVRMLLEKRKLKELEEKLG